MVKKKDPIEENDITLARFEFKPDEISVDLQKAILKRINSAFSIGAVNPYALVNANRIANKETPIDWQENIRKHGEKGFEMNRKLLSDNLEGMSYEHLFDPKFSGPVYRKVIENLKERTKNTEKFFERKDVISHFTVLVGPMAQNNTIAREDVLPTIDQAIQNGTFDQRLMYRRK